VRQRHIPQLRVREPQRQVGEGQVGDHLPVPHEQMKPLGVPRPEISVFPDGVGKDCHSTSICDAGTGRILASND